MDNEKEYLESSEGEDEMSDSDSIIDNNEKNNLNRLGLTKVRLQIQYLIPKFQSPKLGLEVDLTIGG